MSPVKGFQAPLIPYAKQSSRPTLGEGVFNGYSNPVPRAARLGLSWKWGSNRRKTNLRTFQQRDVKREII